MTDQPKEAGAPRQVTQQAIEGWRSYLGAIRGADVTVSADFLAALCDSWLAQAAGACGMSARTNEPMPQYRLKEDYPLMYERALDYDFAERLGGSTSKLDAEIDAAMRELWESRRGVANHSLAQGFEGTGRGRRSGRDDAAETGRRRSS